MKKVSILLLALSAIAFQSCKNNDRTPEPEVVTVDNTVESVKTYAVANTDAEFNDPAIEGVFKQYLQVENALVNTDAEVTSSEAGKLKVMLNDNKVQADEETQNAVIAMSESSDIKVQRENFEILSAWMEKNLQGALKSGTIYKQFCPMAFNNRGAYWISTSKDILNPYFGDKMLKCGRVEAEIR